MTESQYQLNLTKTGLEKLLWPILNRRKLIRNLQVTRISDIDFSVEYTLDENVDFFQSDEVRDLLLLGLVIQNVHYYAEDKICTLMIGQFP